jgi:hypothetical protein
MNSLVNYDANNVSDIEYYVKNIIFTIVCIALITYILIKIRRLFSQTIQKLNKMIYDLDKKLTIKIQELDQMKQLDETTSKQLKMCMCKLQQLEYNIVLLESRMETITYEYIDDIINRLSLVETNVATNKNLIERHTTEIAYSKQNHKETLDNIELLCEGIYNFKIDFGKEITELKGCNEEKMSLIKAYNKDAMYKTELLNDKLTAVTSGYDDTLKDMLHTMNTMFNSQISLKTEFEERNRFVAIGFVGSMSGDLLLYKNAEDVSSLNELIEYGHSIKFDISCLKYFPKLKTIDLFELYRRGSSIIYVSNMSNILDNRDNTMNNIYHRYKHDTKTHLLFKEEGTRKVIEYIRSIRPDIELTWYQTPL